MSSRSLFGHLATRFSVHPENLATEALLYILKLHPTAAISFITLLSASAEIEDSIDLTFQTQVVGEDQSIPDLVGIGKDGQQKIIVEAKFWAGLTDNQPTTYIRRLPDNGKGVLLFVAPEKRLSILWPELIRRCQINGISIDASASASTEFFTAKIDHNRTLGLISWRALLGSIQRSLELEGIHDAVADVVQLQGLCNRMDEEAFLPLHSEELTGYLGTRIKQFCQLTDEVTQILVNKNIASTSGLRATAGSGWYGRYMRIGKAGCLLHFSAYKWSAHCHTPIWLRITDSDWKSSLSVKEALNSLLLEDPPRAIEEEEGLLVPIYLLTQAEKDAVVEDILRQVKEIAKHLENCS